MIGSSTSWRSAPAGPLLLVLLSMLALSAFLAYQAWSAARSHRQVTEAALRDYAGFAAWELRRRVETRANAVLNAALTPARVPMVLRGEGPGDDPDMEIGGFLFAVEHALIACECADAVSDYFSIDLESHELHVWGPTMDAELRAWLTGDFLDQARSVAARYDPDMIVRREVGRGGLVMVQRLSSVENVFVAEPPVPVDSGRLVIYAAGVRGESRRVVGFVLDVARFAEPLVADVFSGPSLLPLSLTGDAPNGDVLLATVWTERGDTVFRTRGGFTSDAGVVDTFRVATGPLAARVAVRPEMASRLVIGGLPRSRVPVLLGSVVLTLGLVVIAGVQLRRQQELFRLRADFVAGVSHELRTPLAQIRLFSDLLGSDRLDEAQSRRSIRILTEETKRLTYLVENVLRFSRSERRMERIAPVPLEVGSLLREIADDFAPLARSREARIVVEAPDGLRAPLDADAVRQVVLNLLDNAVKYGPRGQRIDLRGIREGEWLRVEVDDEGPGIPAADRERIWEPYRRLSREVEVSTGGSGIGLSVVRELVALHGGTAFVIDGNRGGSRFVVRLPGAAESVEAAVAEPGLLERSPGVEV